MLPFSEAAHVDERAVVNVIEMPDGSVAIQGFRHGYDGGKLNAIFFTRAAALKVADMLVRWAARPKLGAEPSNVVQQAAAVNGEAPLPADAA